MNFEELMPTLIDYGIQWGLVFLKAIAIFVIGRIAAGVITNILNRVMKRSKMDDMLRKFWLVKPKAADLDRLLSRLRNTD